MRRFLVPRVLLVAFVAAAYTAACGGNPPSTGGGAAPTSNGATSFQDFAKCMREHGQNVPDPDPNSGNVALTPPPGGASAAWNTAMQACQHFLPNNGQPAVSNPQELEALRSYAVCMRGHGIELTDPDPSTGRSKIQGRLANATRDQVINDPTYQAADGACKDKLPNGASPKGAGG
jgi:hypothetical protein